MFHVINIRTDKPILKIDGKEPHVFSDGKTANTIAKALQMQVREGFDTYSTDYLNGVTVHHKDKWQVRNAVTDTGWREREASLFASGKYELPTWAADPDWIKLLDKNKEYADHFVHRSAKDPDQVAYTPDEKAGQGDKQVRTTPARYFEKHLSSVKPELIKKWLSLHRKAMTGDIVHMATTQEEVRRVYERGPDSCMKGAPNRFFSHKGAQHPAEAYIGGDLALAYVEHKGTNQITARALVWPKMKRYGRVYGSESNVLNDFFAAEGWSSERMDGAKLARIQIPDSYGTNLFLMPYMDSPNDRLAVEDGNIVIRQNGPIGGGTTSGYIQLPIPYISAFSGKEFYTNVDPTVEVWHDGKAQRWANSEVQPNAFYDRYDGLWYSKSGNKRFMYFDQNGMPQYISEKNKKRITMCEKLNVPVMENDIVSVIVGYSKSGGAIRARWSALACNSGHGFTSGSSWYANHMRSRLPWAFRYAVSTEHGMDAPVGHKIGRFAPPEDVTAENIELYARRAIFVEDSNGNMSMEVTTNAELEKRKLMQEKMDELEAMAKTEPVAELDVAVTETPIPTKAKTVGKYPKRARA